MNLLIDVPGSRVASRVATYAIVHAFPLIDTDVVDVHLRGELHVLEVLSLEVGCEITINMFQICPLGRDDLRDMPRLKMMYFIEHIRRQVKFNGEMICAYVRLFRDQSLTNTHSRVRTGAGGGGSPCLRPVAEPCHVSFVPVPWVRPPFKAIGCVSHVVVVLIVNIRDGRNGLLVRAALVSV